MSSKAPPSSSATNSTDFNFSTTYTFNNESFQCQIYTTQQNGVLVIEVESQETFERWRGEFPAQSIEAVTQKTGNFKKFSVFVKMLYSSLTQNSETVTIDLLTRQQLELLFRKNRQTFQTKNSNQRYLILTYAVEFDRVHYPLPLSFEEPSVERLKETIRKLKQKPSQNADVARLQQEVISLREENDSMKSRLQHQREQISHLSSQQQRDETDSTLALEMEQLKNQNDRLKKEKHQLRVALERKKKESENEIQVMQRECDILAADLKRQSEEMEQMRLQVLEAHNGENVEYLKRKLKKYKQEIRRLEDELRHLASAPASAPTVTKRRTTPRSRSRLSANRSGSRPTSRNSSFNRQRHISPARRTPISRNGSASKRRRSSAGGSSASKSRFDPTDYIRQQQAKRKRAKERVKQRQRNGILTPRSINSSRRSSIERRKSTGRASSSRRGSVERRRILADVPLPRSSSKRNRSNMSSRNSSRGGTPTRRASDRHLDPQLLRDKLTRLQRKRSTSRRSSSGSASKKKSQRKRSSYVYSSSGEELEDDVMMGLHEGAAVSSRRRRSVLANDAVPVASDRRLIRSRLRKRYDLGYDTDESDYFDDSEAVL